MSDFIYSSTSKPQGELIRHIHSIYHSNAPEVTEFHGEWGSLAVSRNLYNGFQPLETQLHVFVLIGGPVLCFKDNLFLINSNSTAGTRAIYERYIAGLMQWDEDLSGPFLVLMIDKSNGQVTIVTDLMMFIPAYHYAQGGAVMLGTHMDAMAKAAYQTCYIDQVSLADFILNNVVTYPYTVYKNLRQLHPAAVQSFEPLNDGLRAEPPTVYWSPEEMNPYVNIDQAAVALREGLRDYVTRITQGMNKVAQFISAGEDSRAIAGLLPRRLKRDGVTFLDSMNREGRIARRAAKAYKETFQAGFLGKTYYLDILPEASDLIGSGHQYVHAHSLGLYKSFDLDRYSAVFGGFLSDTLLKGHDVQKIKGYKGFPVPQVENKKWSPIYSKINSAHNCLINSIYEKLKKRRMEHFQSIQNIRFSSYKEWFTIWPITMHSTISNLICNRRLFRSYEPFMSKQAVKIGAAVPTSWKLNRRLFHHMAKPLFKPAKYLTHTQGWMPYYPWYANFFIHGAVFTYRNLIAKMGLVKGYQGSFGDRQSFVSSDAWAVLVDKYTCGEENIDAIFTKSAHQLLKGSYLTLMQKGNLLQTLYLLQKMKIE